MTSLLKKKLFLDFKKQPLLTISAITIPLMILIVYWRDLSILANEALYNESVNYIILVPILICYSLYRKKDNIKATFEFEKLQQHPNKPLLTEVFGLIFCLIAFLLYWYGSSTFYSLEIHLISLPVLVTGIILILFNLKTVIVLLFPILFLLFLVPIPSEITYTAGAALANFSTTASFTLLKAFNLPVALESTYGSPTISVDTSSGTPMVFAVDLPCSGIYSLIAFITFATFLAFVTHGPLVKKAGIFLIGFIVMQLLNVIRISSIVAVGYWLGEEIAMTIVHVAAGWLLIFSGMLILLLISEKLLHLKLFRSSNDTVSCPKYETSLQNRESFCHYCGRFIKNLEASSKIPGRFWAKLPILLICLFIVSITLQGPVFAFAQGLTFENPNLDESLEVFPEFTGYILKFLYRDVDYEKLAGQDASLMYAYIPLNGSTPTVYVSIGVANTISNLHNWEVCFVSMQTTQGHSPLVTVLSSRDIQLMENPSIVARYFTFESPENYTQVTLYWYETAQFNTGLTVETKYVRVSLIILAEDSTTYPQYEETLLDFALPISEHWEPLKSQSLFSLNIPLQQGLLIGSTIFLVSTTIAQYTRKMRTKSGNIKVFEKFAAPNEKMLYATIKKINDEKGATTKEIASALEQSGKPNETNELTSMLNHLKQNGLLELDLVTTNDTPQIVWKP